MPRGEKRVVWVPHKGSSKYPEKKPLCHFWFFYLFVSLLPFWIGNHFTYLIIKVYRKYYIDILRMAQSESKFNLFLWYIAIPSYSDLTNPNTILQYILVINFISVIPIIPGNCFHIEVPWLMICCARWVHLRNCRRTDLVKLRIAYLVDPWVQFVIVEHERDVKRKGLG